MLLLITVIGLALLWYFVLSPSRSNLAPSAKNAAQPAQARVELPVRFKIPSINVNAAVEYVGLTPLMDMDAPKDPANVGWYSIGPRPGEVGSAVIDGHFGYRNNLPAVFDNLSKLPPGDKVYVEDKTGGVVIFVVRESRNYDPSSDATAVFRSNDGKAHLNLITCEGTWNESQKSYLTRLVVFTDKEV